MSRFLAAAFCLGACLLTAAALPTLVVAVRADPLKGELLLSGAACAFAMRGGIRRMGFINAFAHEVGHTIVARLTRGRVTRFYATDSEGGHMQHIGGARLPIVVAPYAIPMAAVPLVSTILLLGQAPSPAAAAAIGPSCGFHAVRVLDDIAACTALRWQGTDFAFFGPQATLAVVVGANAVVLATVAAFALDSPQRSGTSGRPRLDTHFRDWPRCAPCSLG